MTKEINEIEFFEKFKLNGLQSFIKTLLTTSSQQPEYKKEDRYFLGFIVLDIKDPQNIKYSVGVRYEIDRIAKPVVLLSIKKMIISTEDMPDEILDMLNDFNKTKNG